ncbi:helix-turn-helix domain-containing protein [Staphylococcus hominis]|uniref:helix-turn-helix domain-containing protein n=1 Tax=Staphylococcus hominis TaxID=1290 RepID=UPI00066D6223|nr:helix-turn-helix transcriptional regulator [Staphylococcus hominis]
MKNNLSMLMGKKRISTLKLSEETGISRNAIYGLYHEKTSNPDIQNLITLCNYFGVSLNEFLNLEEVTR